VLASIEVGTISTSAARQEFGHTLRSELAFAMDGSGASQAARRYELTATVTDSLASPLVSSTTGRAVSGTITAVANWSVTDRESGEVVYRGTANGAASYERTVQRFASLRAQRDAETRLARQLSEQIAQRLAIDIRAARRDI
jgi:LPS-assembly lipoprotein